MWVLNTGRLRHQSVCGISQVSSTTESGQSLLDWTLIKEEYGNIASTIGLVVSTLGFIYTIYQVRKTRQAAEKAQEILNRAGHQIVFTQIFTALTMGREIGNYCRSQEWNRAIDRCEQLRILLANHVKDTRLEPDERDHITSHIDELSLIIRRLGKIARKEEPPDFSQRAMESLDKIIISLSQIDGRLRTEMLEA